MNGAAGVGRTARVTIHSYDSREPAPRTNRGYRLQSERKWVIEGDDQALTQIANQLPRANRTWVGTNALILDLVNSVGVLNLPHLGEVELVTGKFGTDQFDAMLRELTESATTLPFSAGEAAAGRYSVSTAPRDEVLYHAFVYLRYILSDRAPERVRLLPALEMIVREPHRLWHSDRRDVRIEAMTRVDAHTPLDLVTRPGMAVVAASLSPSGARLAERLGWRLPEVVSERKIRPTTDTPENRFVKAFIGQARTIIGRMRSSVSSRRPDAFRRNLLRDCDRMEASLMPIARHSMWEEVGRMVRIPFSSTVLQRRRGYRRVLQHFSRIRLAPMIPLDKDGMRDLLELKNIALLYELWTFFRLVHEISAVVGSPPVRSGRLGQRSLPDRFRSWRDLRMGSGRAPGVQPALLHVMQRTMALLLRAADSRHRSSDSRRAERRPPPVRREVPRPSAHRRGTRRGRQGRRRREGRGAGGFVQACRHLQDARVSGRDSGGAVGVDPVSRWGVSVFWGAGGWGAGWRPGGFFA